MEKYKATGLSLPQPWMERIDRERGDVSRSRYVLRMLEKAFSLEGEKIKKLQNTKFGVETSPTKDSEGIDCTKATAESDLGHD